MYELNTEDDIVGAIYTYDEWIDSARKFINKYSGRPKEEVGEEIFNDVICVREKVENWMVTRIMLAIILQTKYGVTV